MEAKIALLPGDGVGPEVTAAAERVLKRVAELGDHRFHFQTVAIGGAAIDATGQPLPNATLAACERADAVLLGAVGGPRWSDPAATVRPEQGLLALRKRFALYANLRPVPIFPAIAELAPIRMSLLHDVDVLVVRELTGGIYFGERREQGDGTAAFDTMLYTVEEVERVAHVAFEAARARRRRVVSVDKANVLAAMRLWRRTVERVAAEYPDVELEHELVDTVAVRLLTSPASFDVILTGNLFGDILSNEASVLAGSLGLLPSASLGAGKRGLYEPVHGPAPEIAGRGFANPIGAILSAALLLRHSLELADEARAVEKAVAAALQSGLRTPDLLPATAAAVSSDVASTVQVTAAVCERLGA